MEAMPTVSSSVEKLPQIPHISLTQRHQTIRHPEKCSKPENDAISGLDLNSLRKLKKKMSNDMKIKTISDYPLLVGEILRRSELRKNRRQRRAVFFRLDRTRST